MSADEKIRKRRTPCSALFTIGQKAFARKESRFPWKRVSPEKAWGQNHLNILDAMETDRDLCVNNRIDDQDMGFRILSQRIRRPLKPLLVFRNDIENDVTIHQDIQTLSPGERQNLIGRHFYCCLLPHAMNQITRSP